MDSISKLSVSFTRLGISAKAAVGEGNSVNSLKVERVARLGLLRRIVLTLLALTGCQSSTVGQSVGGSNKPSTSIDSKAKHAEIVEMLRAAYTDWRSRAKVKGRYVLSTGV